MIRLRVLQVLECGGPGGTGNQVAALCGLDSEHFETILAYALRGGTCAEYERLAAGAARYFHVPEMTREIAPLKDFAALWELYRIILRERPLIVHAHSSKAGVLARAAAWLARVPRIYYSPHGYAFQQTDRGPLSRALYLWVERIFSRIGEVVAVSDSEAFLARDAVCAPRVTVVKDAFLGDIPAEPPARHTAGRPVTICTVGRMSTPRPPEPFVRMAWRLSNTRADARCLWIGSGELRPQFDRLREMLRLEGCLEATGWLPHNKALEQLKKADILVHYSRWEGLPNAVLEGMALGLPVVASDVPGNRELIVHGENGFIAGSEAELSAHVLRLTKEPDLRARFGRRGWEIARERYSKDRLLAEMASLYSK